MSVSDREFLLGLQRQAITYFLENQTADGLMLDRQRNHSAPVPAGLCSTAATGMGFIALALASAPPFRLIPPCEAIRRITAGVEHALKELPQDCGILPHFIDSTSRAVHGRDHFSTIDSAWLFAGALWSAEFLGDPYLEYQARKLYGRIDWRHWSSSAGLMHHGKDREGRFLDSAWDRLNGETVFMYVLAAGAEPERALPPVTQPVWQVFPGSVAGHDFHDTDLGLFVFQYGLDLLDLNDHASPMAIDLHQQAGVAARANRLACRHHASHFRTYERFWGLSAGDGPCTAGGTHEYRAYAPTGPIDGTAHLTATLASVAHLPNEVLTHLRDADGVNLRGRYGFSNVNLDCDWRARDMVGIDAGAAVLALDNFLMEDRVRRVFHRLPLVERGLNRLGFRHIAAKRAS